MNEIISWVSTVTSPFTSLTEGKWVRFFFLVLVSICLAAACFLQIDKTNPSLSLIVERVEASPALLHTPEPAALNDSIAIAQSLPPPITISAPTPPTPDPLLLEHSKKLAELDTVFSQVKGDIAGMANRLDGFQTDLQGIKQELAQRPPVLLKARPTPHKAESVLYHPHRQRANALNTPGFQIVALNKWGDESRLIVKQQGSNQYRQLRLGDPLSGGTIVDMTTRKITIRSDKGIATVELGKAKP